MVTPSWLALMSSLRSYFLIPGKLGQSFVLIHAEGINVPMKLRSVEAHADLLRPAAGQAEAELKDFSPYYRRQFSIARFLQVEDDLEQRKEKTSLLLMQKVPGCWHRSQPALLSTAPTLCCAGQEARQEAEVLYEEHLFYFDEARKWRDRYVVVRANHSLECHHSPETFVKGVPPRQKLLPTGGAALTTEDAYMAMVDRCFPDHSSEQLPSFQSEAASRSSAKEDLAPPLSAMPGGFPVYLRLPYRRDWFFCFKQETKRNHFLSILTDCIRHQNQDFLKKKTCEVQAFLQAVQLRRQDGGSYEPWAMLTGSDVRVMGNLVMEKLLPRLEKELLPRLRARRAERKRLWFATVEAAYILAQEHLLEGLSLLKEECRVAARQQEVLIHSDMDQILESRRQLQERVRAVVTEPAEKLCSECVRPYLDSVLEELMEPISCGFQEGRQLLESLMEEVCQSAQRGDKEAVRKLLPGLAKPNLLSCYQEISSVQDKQQNLQDTFGFSNTSGLIHSTQLDLEQLVENAAFTFEQLLYRTFQDNPDSVGSAPEKAKERVLKQYDYDSSTVRKRISGEALLSITLPFIKKKLDPAYKAEIRSLEEFLDPDHTDFVHVENVYENVLQQMLDKEVTRVVKEAATLRKYDLFSDRESVSQSSLTSGVSPLPSSPLAAANGLLAATQQEDVAIIPEAEPSKQAETPTSTADQSEKQEVGAKTFSQQEVAVVQEEAAQTQQEVAVVQQEVAVVQEEAAQTQQEVAVVQQEVAVVQQEVAVVQQEVAETQQEVAVVQQEAAETQQEVARVQQEVAVVQQEVHGAEVEPLTEAEPVQDEAGVTKDAESPACVAAAVSASAGGSEGHSSAQSPEERPRKRSQAPPGVQPLQAAFTVSESRSLDLSSNHESMKEVQATGDGEDEGPMTSGLSEDDAEPSPSPVSSVDVKDKTKETESADASAAAVPEDDRPPAAIPPGLAAEEAEPGPEAPPLDSIKENCDLVMEVMEVEELVQRYPGGAPTDE